MGHADRKRRAAKRKNVAATTALAKVETPAPIQVTSAIPTIKETVENLERVRRFVSKCLNADLQAALAKLPAGQQLDQATRDRLEIDWGTIPGIDKPFLKQPGAEKFLFWLNLRPKYQKREVEMPNGHLEMVASVIVYHKKTGEEVFEGPDCSCTTMESNYRFRFAERDPKPPQEECERLKFAGLGKFKKVRRYAHGKFVKEEWAWLDRIENPNIHDERNKVRQMGEKRALVKCIRNMGAISEIFTADPSEWHIPDEDDDPTNDQDYTMTGRQIIEQDGTTPSGRPVGFQHQHRRPTEEQQEVARKNAAEMLRKSQERHPPKTEVRHTPSEKGEASVALGSASTSSASPKKIITIDIPSDGSEVAYCYGDLTPEVVEYVKAVCLGIQLEGKNAFVFPVEYVINLETSCGKLGVDFQEISGSPAVEASQTPPPGPKESPAVTTEAADVQKGPANSHVAGPSAVTTVSGTVKMVTAGLKSRKGLEHYQLVIGEMGTGTGQTFYCYNKAIWPILDQAKGKTADILVAGKNVVGFKRLGTRTFDSDGVTPEIQNSEERKKTGSLFK